MSMWQAYLLVFLVGPLLMLALTRRAASRLSFILGAAVVCALLATAVFWRAGPNLESLGMVWLAWIGTVTLCVRAAMRRVRTRRSHALVKSFGAMATVIPWIGLAMADWMAT